MKELEQEIYELECSHIHPEVRVSRQKLGDVLDDEFYEIGSSGRIWRMADYNGDHALTPDEMEISNFLLHQLGEEAILTTYQIWNKTSGKKSLRSSVWKKRASGWKLFFHQGTLSE